MKKLIPLLLIFISNMLYSQSTPGVYTVKNTKINTFYSDFGTAFYGKNKVVFAAPKQGITFTRDVRNNNKQPFLDLFIGEVTEDGEIIKKQKMPGDINTKYHEGMVSFSKDLKSVYFSANWYLKKKNKEKRKSTRNIQIFKASINEEGEWIDLALLPFNSTQFSSGHPTLNIDDTKLYFVSDRPGSIGKTDIFVVDIYENGTYSEPRNLGPKINTIEREMFPFISDDNVLYFSSNGYPSYGELDVFASKIYDTTVSDPISLEAPVNSEKDDFAYIINDENHMGYFSSNRKGGKGDDDVYSFTVSPPIYFECQQVISGVVKDIHTQEIIPKALIVLFDEQGNKLQSIFSNQNDGAFDFEQSCNTSYTIKGYLQGHLIGEMDIKTVNDLDVGPLEVILNMDTSLIKNYVPSTLITDNNNDVVENNLVTDKIQDTQTNTDFIADNDTAPSENVTKGIVNTDKNLATDEILSEQTKNNSVTDNNTSPNEKVTSANIVTSNALTTGKVKDSQTNKDLVAENNITSNVDKSINPIPETDINKADRLANNNTQNPNKLKIDGVTDANMNPSINTENEKNIININTIYFDFDKFNIRYDAKIELDKIAEVLTEYPEIEIDVNSHTDSRGKNSYNYSLSNKRANETIQYLVNKGIDPNRISGKGYGELKLFEKCQNGVPCTSLQHQLNRRSEFIIIKNNLKNITFKSNNITSDNYLKTDKFATNSGAFINYNFDTNTEVYTVQIGAFKGGLQTDKFSKLSNLFNHKYNDGFNRYFAGIFETSTEARNYMKLLIKKGYEGAFVLGLKGNDRLY